MSVHTAFDVRPVTGTIGAEVVGADLARDLPAAAVDGLRLALLRRKVLFFRGQDLGPEEQVRFARRLGPLTIAHPTVPSLPGHPHVLELDGSRGGRANAWHTDVTFVDRPPLGAVLRAVTVPDTGGDTIWADTEAAYASLPAELAAIVDRLWAIHANTFDYAVEFQAGDRRRGSRAYADAFTSTAFRTEHPVVRVHPETGERSLLLGAFAQQLRGLPLHESVDLLRSLQTHVVKPEHTVRWRWARGDVVVWDNRSTQHYAVNDYGDAPRVMHRVTIAGDRPVSVDGRVSLAVEGDAGAYLAA